MLYIRMIRHPQPGKKSPRRPERMKSPGRIPAGHIGKNADQSLILQLFRFRLAFLPPLHYVQKVISGQEKIRKFEIMWQIYEN